MLKIPKVAKAPLYSLILGIILMIIVGSISTFQVFGEETPSFVFAGSIVFSLFLFLGFFGGVYVLLREVFYLEHTPRNLLGKIVKGFKKVFVVIFALFISLVALLGTMLVYYNLRLPPSFEVDPILQLETWTVIPSGNQLEKHHQSNTDLYYWNGNFYLIYQHSKWHLEDLNGELIVARSPDARNWATVASIKGPGQNDVRDPLIMDNGSTLFLYFLPNFQFDPSPNTTYYTTSVDGINWGTPQEIYINISLTEGWSLKNGWCFGRQEPLSLDNITWYTMASGRKGEKRMTILIESTDCVNWKEVSVVYDTYGSGEPCMEFLPSGEIIATLRVGSMSSWTGYEFGTPHAGTIIATSYNNHLNWSVSPEFQTRMDGGRMFTLENRSRIFIAGRNHLGPRLDLGNHVSRKRTSLYEVQFGKLIHLFDLPSNGDTAYTGVVANGDDIYVSYYTCPINVDYPWIVGICLFSATEIRMAKFSATGLTQYADNIIGG